MLADARNAVKFALGIVFGLSAGGKLRDPASFVRGVRDFQMVPASLVFPLAALIIVTEAWLAVAHFTGWRLAISAVLAIAMFASFGLAVGVDLRRGLRPPCHCFGG